MRYLYTVAFYLALPFILLRAAWRTRGSKNYLPRLGERLGIYSGQPYLHCLWLHAVSYGEAVAAEPLIQALVTAFPTHRIVVTTMTFTGAMRVQTTWRNNDRIQHLYLPYDIPFAIRRFLKHIQPKLGIIMETELWPNLLHVAQQQHLPLLLANARLSPRSYQGYQRIAKLISPLLHSLAHVGAQSKQDAERFKSLGVNNHNVAAVGNLKFDICPPEQQLIAGATLKKQLPFDHILIAASTHAPEEEQIMEVYSKLKQNFPKSLLILVPRHPERFDEVARLCIHKGHHIVRHSSKHWPDATTTIYIGDSMGDLYFLYALADVAFVGGSLVPMGGHNLLEPAAVKLPIITGPHLFNFADISALLLEAGALHVASNLQEVYSLFCILLQDREHRIKAGLAGFAILAKNQGATQHYITTIAKLMRRGHSAPIQHCIV